MILSHTLGLALAALLASKTEMHVGRRTPSVTAGRARRLGERDRYRWGHVQTTSRRLRDPSDPRQAALINAAQAKRDRRAVKLARDSAKWR